MPESQRPLCFLHAARANRAILDRDRATQVTTMRLNVGYNSEPRLLSRSLPTCTYSPSSSRKGNSGLCLDWCFLHCSRERLRDPEYRTGALEPADRLTSSFNTSSQYQ